MNKESIRGIYEKYCELTTVLDVVGAYRRADVYDGLGQERRARRLRHEARCAQNLRRSERDELLNRLAELLSLPAIDHSSITDMEDDEWWKRQQIILAAQAALART